MSRQVVDASVVIKWYIPEADYEKAVCILDSGAELWMPDLGLSEIGNILWKKNRLGELSKEDILIIANEVNSCPLRIHSTAGLLEATLEIATAFDRTYYDSLYLALAVHLDCELITADKKLFNAIRQTAIAEHIKYLADIV